MRLAFAQIRGAGTRTDPYRPDCDPVGRWSMVDLRPPSQANGHCLVLGKDDTAAIPGALRDLGDVDDLDLPVPSALRTAIENRLGVTFPLAATRRSMIRELLLDLGDDANPNRWNKLRKGRDNHVRLIMGDVELFSIPVVGGGAVNTESFNKADSTTLGPDLTWSEVRGDAEVSGNKWRNVTNNDDIYTRAQHDVGNADMYAQAKVDFTSSGNWFIMCRFSSSAETMYLLSGNNLEAEGARLYRVVANAFTQLGTDHSFATSEGTQYLYRIEAEGSTIRAKIDGTTIATETDSNITTGQRGGLGAFAPTTQVRWDEYEQGTLGSPTLINLSTIDIGNTWGTIADRRDLDLATQDITATFTSVTYSVGNTQYFNLNPINIFTTFLAPQVDAYVPAVGTTLAFTLQPVNIGVGFGVIAELPQAQVITHLVPATPIYYGSMVPPEIIREASLRAITKITSRLEILNGDGTIYLTDLDVESGSITVSLDRDERRTIDLSIHDPDQVIDHHPGGLWYDKIIVPYRGITYREHVWEAPLGRFYIDRISEPDFPYIVSITGRDQTKRLLADKLPFAITFGPDEAPEDVIRVIATNGGVTRMNLETTTKTLGRDFTFERGTSRWEIIANIAEAFSMEVFFDANGYLILRTVRDPTSTPSIWTFQTHNDDANLVQFEKSGDDSRLFNHIVVIGESTAQVPVTAEAENTLAGSGSDIALIGRRTYPYESKFVTTESQAGELAATLLSVMALESYEMNFSSLVASWLEVGEVVDIIDPVPWTAQPTRFLLTDLTIPIGLGTMSGTGKRVQLVR